MTDSEIIVTPHYYQRYRERVARTKRVDVFAKDAFRNGVSIDDVKDSRAKRFLKTKNEHCVDGEECKIYKGCLHVFDMEHRVAITVYCLPYALRRGCKRD